MNGLTLDPAAITAANILAEIRGLAGDYEAATRRLDAITGNLTRLGNDDLAAFGNLIGPTEMEALKTLHLMHGQTVNELAKSAETVLAKASNREPSTPRQVDIRPLETKLAEQFRAITFDGETFGVIDLPQPEPEQPTEPANDAN
jgi:hypothetical protein